MSHKYTFVEFIAALESDDFDNPSAECLQWAESLINDIPKIFKKEYHFGDCTKAPISCNLCIFETLLSDYRKYYFNEIKWRAENL